MKQKIHPKLNNKVKVTCNCGNTFYTTSTLDKIEVEVCSNCHPFYTGVERLVDSAGRADKFKQKQEFAEEKQKEIEKIEKERKKKQDTQQKPLTLKDLLKESEGKKKE